MVEARFCGRMEIVDSNLPPKLALNNSADNAQRKQPRKAIGASFKQKEASKLERIEEEDSYGSSFEAQN